MIKELKDGSIVSLDYGLQVSNYMSRDNPGEYETDIFAEIFTKIYTDGEIYRYNKHNPFPADRYKIGLKEYNNINYLEVDNVFVKNHTYLIKEIYVWEWFNAGTSRVFDPYLKKVDVYVQDKNNFHQVINAIAMKRKIEILKANGELSLPEFNHSVLTENNDVHILRRKH